MSIYRPINSKQGEIRLLALFASDKFDSPLRCQIIYTTLDSHPEYEAVSYVWGRGPFPFMSRIEFESTTLGITPNLDIALRFLRLPFTKRTLWVDAICINQEDISERNGQVALMKNIYQHCKVDLAWLGPEVGSDGRIGDVDVVVKALEMIKIDDTLKHCHWDCNEGRENIMMRAFNDPSLWSRIWVKQELAYAPRVTLLSRWSDLDWEAVASILNDTQEADAYHRVMYHSADSSAEIYAKIFKHALVIQHQRQSSQAHKEDSDLLDVLARFKSAFATDPRDKVYGLIGLVSGHHEIEVDYNKTAQEVFADTAVSIINIEHNLDIICQNPFVPERQSSRLRMANLPSWVPDFSHTNFESYDSVFSSLLFAQRGIYAAGQSECHTPCKVVAGGRLRVRGTVLGAVSRVQAPQMTYSRYKDDIRQYQKWKELFLDPKALSSSTVLYVTGEPILRAFGRSLFADCEAYPLKRLNKNQIDSISSKIANNNLVWGGGKLDNMLNRLGLLWKFGATKNGIFFRYKGVLKEDDLVIVLDGGKVPVIIRLSEARDSQESSYEVLSTAYVHGFMDGEAKVAINNGKLSEIDFLLN